MTSTLSVVTRKRTELVDVTARVQEAVSQSGVREGVCVLYVPHTTAAVAVNEGYDPSVAEDIAQTLSDLVPPAGSYAHTEGNADAHVKAAMLGASEQIPVAEGRLLLGRWQAIFFCEFDGPRERRIYVTVIGNRV
ncbi:MAG: secondary thiamine-phosphate synthase enzyme YjbQ [candidate division WOR-3 bacterium]